MRAYLQANQILKEERKNTKLPIKVAAEIARKVQDVWVKGGIPTVSHTRIVQKFHLSQIKILITNEKYKIKRERGEISKQTEGIGKNSSSYTF